MKNLFLSFPHLWPGRVWLLALFLLPALPSNLHAQKEWYVRDSVRFTSPVSISVVDSFFIYVLDRKGLHKSTDGGFTWRQPLTTPFYDSQVKFTSRANGLVVNYYGQIQITTDGGDSWQSVANAGSSAKMVFLDSVHAITFRTGSESSGYKISFGKTSDRGATWQYSQTLLHSGVLFWIDQVDSGFIAASRDFGRSFTYTKLNTNGTIILLDVTPEGDLYAWSDDNRLFSTIKIKPSPVSVDDAAGTPASFSLSQNYPNPFNPETVIRYALPSSVYAKGVVYDILGREVATLLNAEMPAGEHQLKFDAAQLPSGVYIFRLEAGEYSSTIKMIATK